ncbi:hypothetical protein IC575_017221 [Cucumis melo]
MDGIKYAVFTDKSIRLLGKNQYTSNVESGSTRTEIKHWVELFFVSRGIITAGHRGGGHKRLYRKIDFRRNEKDIYGRIVTIEYDPNRNAYICLIHYGDGEKRYILHPRGYNWRYHCFWYRSFYKNGKCPTFECGLNY